MTPIKIEEYIDQAIDWAIHFAPQLVLALLTLFVGWWALGKFENIIVKQMQRRQFESSLQSFLRTLFSLGTKIILLIIVAGQIGFQTTSLAAIVGAAGLAVGLALQGSLANFAGGVLILIFKPFKVGDFVMTQGEQGTVKEIQIFNTYLHTSDNKVIILPNGPVANGNITNFTKAEKRRVDFIFGIAYGDNVQIARDVLTNLINSDERIMQDPAPFIGLGALTNNSVDIVVRVWTKTEDYWNVHFDLNEKVYKEFEKNGLHFPSPTPQISAN